MAWPPGGRAPPSGESHSGRWKACPRFSGPHRPRGVLGRHLLPPVHTPTCLGALPPPASTVVFRCPAAGIEAAWHRGMSRLTAPLALAVFAIAVPLLALLALANGSADWDDDADAGEACSLT